MIGSLMEVMTATQPDIAYAIGYLSRYNHEPSTEHIVTLKRVLRCLHGTKDRRVLFRLALRGEGDGAVGYYIDSGYAGCPDDYKSTSGLVITFRGAVNWRLRR
jgi:hypothetical protein